NRCSASQSFTPISIFNYHLPVNVQLEVMKQELFVQKKWDMKKSKLFNCECFWHFMPARNAHRPNLVVRSIIFTLLMGWALPSNAGAAGAPGALLSVTVSGKVTDEATGQPMPGVNVLVKGAHTGASADAEGKYSITVA